MAESNAVATARVVATVTRADGSVETFVSEDVSAAAAAGLLAPIEKGDA